ncbi:MAG: FAD binding domain-containing protein [Burkholderiales bacterium]|jgi:xanthine dehydrogenase FAD-binding subunit|nr:FAD binding domain-containing protein [Burkholderiales bacterium]
MSAVDPVSGQPPAPWYRPVSLADALSARARWRKDIVAIAGCTDLMVGWNAGARRLPPVLDLSALAELRSIEAGPDSVTIGATASCASIARHPVIAGRLPMLVASARQTGSVAIQNRATLGGNIMNASPAADNPPVLLAYGARLTLASVRGIRTIDYASFHAGYKRTLAEGDELLVSVTVPFPAERVTAYYRKVGTRRAQAISKIAMAALIERDDGAGPAVVRNASFGFASVGPVPLPAPSLSRSLRGLPLSGIDRAQVERALAADLAPLDDIRSTAAYRRSVAVNLVLAAIDAAREAAPRG